MAKSQKPVPYASMRLAKAAYLAGAGHSATEIGAATGMKTGHVYWLLFTHHIRLAPKTAADAVLPPLMVSRKTMDGLESLSKNLAMPPDWMLARLLEAVIAEPTVAANLLDGVKAPKAKAA